MNQDEVRELIKDIRRRFRRRARREGARVKGKVKIVIKEGKPIPKTLFGAAELAPLDAKKLPDLRRAKKKSWLISNARRHYVLGDEEAFVDT
jgi:hypothetical protein